MNKLDERRAAAQILTNSRGAFSGDKRSRELLHKQLDSRFRETSRRRVEPIRNIYQTIVGLFTRA